MGWVEVKGKSTRRLSTKNGGDIILRGRNGNPQLSH